MPTFLFLAAVCLLVADASPKKNTKLEKGPASSGNAESSPDEEKNPDKGPSKAKGGLNLRKAVTRFLALQSGIGLAHGTQTPSEVTFKVPAVNNQTSTPEMIMTNDYAPVGKRPPIHNRKLFASPENLN